MPSATESLIQTGLEHLGRFAFYTRDNPFVSSRAAFELSGERRSELAALLDGESDLAGWIESGQGRRQLATIKVGLVPRDMQLVMRDDEQVVGVKSVHAFFHADLFWWLVSILWCIEIGAAIEDALGKGIKGYRLEESFVADPTTSGLMFRNRTRSHKEWREFPRKIAEQHPRESLTTVSFDMRAFYYSVEAGPAAIQRTFFAAKGRRGPRSARLAVLSRLLDFSHKRYAELCAAVQPRRRDLGEEGSSPLPVGLPSSRLLANMIMAVALGEIEARPHVLAAAAYADDLILLSRTLPEMEEAPLQLLARFGLVSAQDQERFAGEAVAELATLKLGAEKSGVSFTRHVPSGDPDQEKPTLREALGMAEDDWDPYLEESDSPDWGGQLQTVLHAPLRRERVPAELKREITRLVEQVRVGMTAREARRGFERLVRNIDDSQLLALRPYWCELLVIGIAAEGIEEAVRGMSGAVRQLVESTTLPEGSTAAGRESLRFGLVESWRQALAQALAVASGPDQRRSLLKRMPNLNLGRGSVYRIKSSVDFAMRIRRSRLVPERLVAVPLAEFTRWQGKLIGPGAYSEFIEWHHDNYPNGNPKRLARAVGDSVRFIPLHEACIAMHLWAGRPNEEWLKQAFAVLGGQPLIRASLVEDLQRRSIAAMGSSGRGPKERARPEVLIAMPSIKVPEDQLKAELAKDRERLWEISRRSLAVLHTTMKAAKRTDAELLVLPEWSVAGQHLTRLMEEARKAQMMVIAGQAPEVSSGQYHNRLWTGIPIRDRLRRRHCLVPPPRQKRFLSPEEKRGIEARDLAEAPSVTEVEVYSWRGILIASLLCFEFADIEIRQQLRFRADVVTVSSLNHDWHYFEVVQDSTTRDNYCLTICVNTGAYPGTRITRPTEHEMAVAASVHGSDNLALITRRIDMRPIIAAQRHKRRPSVELGLEQPTDDMRLKNYKHFPPV